ncbi:phage baseplate assembly protein V (plasmid) [Vibrio cyclitrophicus]|uniref:phage baseplate assembly protein V n=1 Tax=Vibrio cyclitrophicus TaxID=47951 RepID=UPI000C8325DD|nr:phage baseplate assembly protein V [Vibrio cyclitrophicus]PMJ43423.1 hypothetical protein BCU22_09720 [Vibrio cyclitrophicus]
MRQTHNISISVGNLSLQQLEVLRFDTEQSINKVPSAKLVLSLPARARMDLGGHAEASSCQPGETINITLKEHNNNTLFKGVITTSEFSIEREETHLVLNLKHDLVALTNTLRSQVYQDMTDTDIVAQLCGAVSNQVTMATKHEQKVQYRCSDWTMLKHCLDSNNAWLIADPEEVSIIEPTLSPVVPLTHQINAEQTRAVSVAQWRFSALEQPKTMTVSSWDVASQKMGAMDGLESELGSGALQGDKVQQLNDEPWEIHYSSSQTEAEISAWADRLRLQAQLERVQGQVQLDGTVNYALGDTLELMGFGQSLDGKGIITAICHHLTPSEWKTDIKIGQATLERYATPLPNIEGVHIGIVGEYDDSADELYRLRVHIPTFSDDKNKNQLWARFSMPYASKTGGLYCYPELGDEVLLMFFENNPSYPVILGAMHNPENQPLILPDEKEHHTKGWRLHHDDGELFMNLNTDTHDVKMGIEESSELRTSAEDGVELISAEPMLIGSDDKLTMTSSKALNIGAYDELKITSTKALEVGSDDGITISAIKASKVTSNQSVEIAAPQIKLKN